MTTTCSRMRQNGGADSSDMMLGQISLDDYIWQLFIVVTGGVTVLLAAHFSRKNWNAEYGEKTGRENTRFIICLVASYFLLTLLVYLYPIAFIVFAIFLATITQIGIGPFHLFNEKPGLKKDIFYGSAIGTILTAITGLFIHAS